MPIREREQPPRFAQPGSFEYEYAMRWKALMEMEKQQFEQVDRNIKEAQEKLETEMEAARHEHQVMLMRQGGHTKITIFWRWPKKCFSSLIIFWNRLGLKRHVDVINYENKSIKKH